MFIQTEPTPNPASLKFIPGIPVMGGPDGKGGVADFPDEDSARHSPLARRLFALNGVERVFLGADFVTVTAAPDADWSFLRADVLGALMDHFTSGFPAVEPGAPEPGIHTDDPLVAQIVEILETRVRPAVARDGGDIVFHRFEDGIVYLSMRGACAGCPSSTATLKMGIEGLLRRFVPEVREVRATQDF